MKVELENYKSIHCFCLAVNMYFLVKRLQKGLQTPNAFYREYNLRVLKQQRKITLNEDRMRYLISQCSFMLSKPVH